MITTGHRRRKKGSKSNEAKEKVFTEELAQYFFIAHQEAQATIAADRLRTKKMKDEDVEFLSALKVHNNVCLGSEDQTYTKKVERNMKRTEAYLKMKSDQKQSKKACFRRLVNLQVNSQKMKVPIAVLINPKKRSLYVM